MNTTSRCSKVRSPLLYDFLKGHPNDNELPVDDLQVLFRSVSNESLRSALQYGQGCGNIQLIQELKSFIQRQCDTDVGPNNNDTNHNNSYIGSFFITEGVSHSIDLLTVVATQPGDYVLTEQPTYFLIAGIFHTHNLNVRTMPMCIETNGGVGSIDFDTLENNFINGSCPIPRMIYIIPAYHNPTGRCMTNEERTRLTLLAYKYKILVVADEVYHLLDWSNDNNQPHQHRSSRMVTWNSIAHSKEVSNQNKAIDGNSPNQKNDDEKSLLYGCVSVSSFTKIFGPGIRCGWIEAESHIIHFVQNYVGYIQSQGAVGPVIGSVLAEGLSNRIIDNVVQRLRDQYQIRCNKLCNILERESELQLTCRPTGGYFVWVRFPNSLNLQSTNEFLDYCLDHGVRFMPGIRCNACPVQETPNIERKDKPTSLHSYARFCFAKLNETDIENGAELFLKCFRSFMKLIHSSSYSTET